MKTQRDRASKAEKEPLRPGFALYAVGISVWMALVSLCGTTYMLPLVPSQADAGIYALTQQITYVATYFVVAIIGWRTRGSSQTWLLTAASFSLVLLLASLVAVALSPHPLWLLVMYGMLMGASITLGYMEWIPLVSYRPTREIELLLFVASFASVASGVLAYFIPLAGRLVIVGVLLIPASLVLLHKNRDAIAPLAAGHADSARPISESSPRQATAVDAPPQTGASVTPRQLVPRLSMPVICSVVLVLVAPIVSTLYADTWGQDLFRTMLAQAANLAALVALWLVYVGLGKKVSVVGAYCTLLPLLASAVLVGAFFEPAQRWFVLFFGDACFCVVSFLLLLNSCTISKETGVPTTVVYGIMGGFVYLARVPEVLLILYPSSPLEHFSPIVTALLLYLLVIPAFLLPLARGGLRDRTDVSPQTQPKPDEERDPLAQACRLLGQQYGLPPRQVTLLHMLAEGQGVPRISQELHLSENTVRTYRKALYGTLGIHSRQELVDLVREEARELHQDSPRTSGVA